MDNEYDEAEKAIRERFKRERNERDEQSYREFLRNMKRYNKGK